MPSVRILTQRSVSGPPKTAHECGHQPISGICLALTPRHCPKSKITSKIKVVTSQNAASDPTIGVENFRIIGKLVRWRENLTVASFLLHEIVGFFSPIEFSKSAISKINLKMTKINLKMTRKCPAPNPIKPGENGPSSKINLKMTKINLKMTKNDPQTCLLYRAEKRTPLDAI